MTKRKISADVGECWPEYVDEYSSVASGHGLSQNEKKK